MAAEANDAVALFGAKFLEQMGGDWEPVRKGLYIIEEVGSRRDKVADARGIPLAVSNPDFHRVATWTSAHTAFVDDCQLGVLEAPSPSIFTVLSSFTEFNFSDLLARRVAPKHKDLKDALPVLSLLMRGLHTSARGWDVLLSQFVPKSTCVRTIVGRALAVSCTGMHENVHPALRLPAQARGRRPPTSACCCLLYTSPSPRDRQKSRMPSSA